MYLGIHFCSPIHCDLEMENVLFDVILQPLSRWSSGQEGITPEVTKIILKKLAIGRTEVTFKVF